MTQNTTPVDVTVSKLTGRALEWALGQAIATHPEGIALIEDKAFIAQHAHGAGDSAENVCRAVVARLSGDIVKVPAYLVLP